MDKINNKKKKQKNNDNNNYYYYTHLMASFPRQPVQASTRKVKSLDLNEAPRSRQITTPTPCHPIFSGRMLFLTPSQQ